MKRFICLLFGLLIYACNKSELAPLPPIEGFRILGLPEKAISIDEKKREISVSFPFQSNTKDLIFQIYLPAGITCVPKSNSKIDLSKTVYLTLIQANGAKAIYNVRAIIGEQPKPEIYALNKDTVEAGAVFAINGKHFGRYKSDISVFIIKPDNSAIKIDADLLDSTKIEAKIPQDFESQKYTIRVEVGLFKAIAPKPIFVDFASPVLWDISRHNVIEGDTVFVTGQNLDLKKYPLKAYLNSKLLSNQFEVKKYANKIGFVIDKNEQFGTNALVIRNEINKRGSKQNFELEVFDANLPWVIRAENARLKSTEELVVHVKNFEKRNTRFYQVKFLGAKNLYFQHGLYRADKKNLTVQMPANIKADTYGISVDFLSDSGQLLYALNTDLKIQIL